MLGGQPTRVVERLPPASRHAANGARAGESKFAGGFANVGQASRLPSETVRTAGKVDLPRAFANGGRRDACPTFQTIRHWGSRAGRKAPVNRVFSARPRFHGPIRSLHSSDCRASDDFPVYAASSGMATIAILGTMDSKGVEHAFVAERIKERGHRVFVIDVGTLGEPALKPDITREEVATAGGINLAALRRRQDRGESVAAMSQAAPLVLSKLAAEKKIDGVISLGGGGGTAIATAAMRALPLGFPKVMVSTLASGNTAQYVGVKDIVMFPAIVDVPDINRFSRQIPPRAAGAICGMVEAGQASRPAGAGETPALPSSDKPIVVASMFGNTTQWLKLRR